MTASPPPIDDAYAKAIGAVAIAAGRVEAEGGHMLSALLRLKPGALALEMAWGFAAELPYRSLASLIETAAHCRYGTRTPGPQISRWARDTTHAMQKRNEILHAFWQQGEGAPKASRTRGRRSTTSRKTRDYPSIDELHGIERQLAGLAENGEILRSTEILPKARRPTGL